MAKEEPESSLSHAVDAVVDKLKGLPASQPANIEPSPPSTRLFGRERSVHELLGGSKAADVILWRNKKLSAGILAGSTATYLIFEWLGFHLLYVLCFLLLIVFATLFLWSNAAAFMKRSPPPVPKVYISEDTAIRMAAVIKDETNRIVGLIQRVVLGKDIKLFLKLEMALWAIALIGKWCDFLTLLFLDVLLLFTLLPLYEKYEDKVDPCLQRGFEQSKRLHRKFCDQVWSKVPHLHTKDRKSQ